MTQMEQDAYMDIVLKTLGRRIEELEDFAEVTKQNYMNERKARTDEGDALRARIDEYKRITNMRNNEVCELNDLVLKKSNEIDELKKELGYVKAQNEDLKEDRHVKTAEEIAVMCMNVGVFDCSACREFEDNESVEISRCRIKINRLCPRDWDANDMAAINYLIKFATQPEPTTLDVIVTDDEADE